MSRFMEESSTNITQDDVNDYANTRLSLSILSGAGNNCSSNECLANKIMSHRMHRETAYWQSMLMHRYLESIKKWLDVEGGTHEKLSFVHARIKKVVRKNQSASWLVAAIPLQENVHSTVHDFDDIHLSRIQK